MPEADQAGNEPKDNLRELRQQADAAKQAQADAEAARRELAFVKAGVDTDSKLGKLLLKTYEGDLTVEAIQTEAREIGAVKVPEAESEEREVNDEERAQSRERRDLSTDSGAPGADDPNPKDVAFAAFELARKNGDPAQIAAGAYFAEMLKAAHAGDKRVLL